MDGSGSPSLRNKNIELGGVRKSLGSKCRLEYQREHSLPQQPKKYPHRVNVYHIGVMSAVTSALLCTAAESAGTLSRISRT